MPILNGTIGPVGPTLEIGLGLVVADVQALLSTGGAAPPPVTCRALIDTGADTTAVDPAVIAPLGAVPVNWRRVRRVAHAGFSILVPVYRLRLCFGPPAGNPHWLETLVVDATPVSPGIALLLGRDVLDLCVFLYNGRAGTFSLTYLAP